MGDLSLLIEEIQPSTAVQNAVVGCFVRRGSQGHGSDLEPKQLLVSCGDYLQLWDAVGGTLETRQTFHLLERVEHMDKVPSSLGLFGEDSPDAVLVFTFDGRCCLWMLNRDPARKQFGISGAALASGFGDVVLTEVACLTIPMPHMRGGLMPKRIQGVCSSGVAPIPSRTARATGALGLVVAAIHMGLLHVITLHAASNAVPGSATGGHGDKPTMICTAVQISETPLSGLPPGSDPIYAMQHMTHVEAMCFLPPPERDGFEPPLLAVLHKPDKTPGISVQLDTLAVQVSPPPRPKGAVAAAGAEGSGKGRGATSYTATAGSAAGAIAAAAGSSSSPSPAATAPDGAELACPVSVALVTGPFAGRSLHPTTTLLAPFPAFPAANLPAGLLVVSSRTAVLYGRPPSLGQLAAVAARSQAARREAEGQSPGSAGPEAALEVFSRIDPLDDEAAAEAFERCFGRDFLEDAAVELAEATVRRLELAQYDMGGLPTCVEALAPGVLVIGDAAAGLHLLHAGGSKPWFANVSVGALGGPSAAAAAASTPSVMRFLPRAAAAAAEGGSPGAAAEGGSRGAAVEPDGLLFLGSGNSSSQVLAVPASHTAPAAPPPSSPSLEWPLAEVAAIKSLAPVMDVVVVPDSAGADDPWIVASCGSGAAGRLVRARMAVGLQPYMADGPQVPDGCRMFALRLEDGSESSAAGGSSSSSGPSSSGPRGPLAPSHGAEGHTHVAFSFEAASRTDLLSVSGGPGGVFSQVELPGLESLAPSLLVADVGGRRLVQVLQSGIRVLEPLSAGGGLAAQWRASEPLSLAAHSGTLLAAASRTRLDLLRVDVATGAVHPLSYINLAAQLSALALCRLAPPPPQVATGTATSTATPGASTISAGTGAGPDAEAAATVVLMGQWHSNRVEVVAAADPAGRPLLQQQLSEDETPRSLGLMELPAGRPPVLLAGTHTGRLMMWQLTAAAAGEPASGAALLLQQPWQVGPCYSVRISQVAVEMVPMVPPPAAATGCVGKAGGGATAGGGCSSCSVYLHSGYGALVRARPATTAAAAPSSLSTAGGTAVQAPLEELVEVVRVHGSEGLQALCHVSTTALPDSACWVTREGRLLFGRVDPRVRLRWSTAFVGETIHSLAYHAASRCLVALCESEPDGDNSIRVVHADSLRQVMSMRLTAGHYHTALAVAPLPCTSASVSLRKRDGASDRPAAAPAGSLLRHPGAGGGSIAGAVTTAHQPEKEFVVLASFLLLDSATDPRVSERACLAPGSVDLQQGVLSFLELVARPAEDGSNATRYSLLLHGTCTIASVATALAVARPMPYNTTTGGTDGGDAAAAATSVSERIAAILRPAAVQPPPPPALPPALPPAQQPASGAGERDPLYDRPYLLAGCHDGVHLYQVHVDDVGVDGSRAVNRALELVGQLDELNLPLPRDSLSYEAALRAAIAKITAGRGRPAATTAAGEPMSTDGGGGGSHAVEDEGLAEDESELPEVEDWSAGSRGAAAGRDGGGVGHPGGDQQGAAGVSGRDELDEQYDKWLAWTYGLGALDVGAISSSSGEEEDAEEEEEGGSRPGASRGPGPRAKASDGLMALGAEEAKAVRALQARFQKEDATRTVAAANAGGGGGGDDDEDSDDGSGDSYFSSGGEDDDSGAARGVRAPRRARRGPLRRLLRDLARDWNHRVSLQLLSRAPTFGGGCVVSLACGGHYVVAGDFLGSVTVMQLLALTSGSGTGTAAASAAGSRSGVGGGGGGGRSRTTVALVPTSVDRHPIFAQASLPLDPSCGHVLVSVHPHGLAVLRRDVDAEERSMREAQRQAVADFEAGTNPRLDGADDVWNAAVGPPQPAGPHPANGAPSRRNGRPAAASSRAFARGALGDEGADGSGGGTDGAGGPIGGGGGGGQLSLDQLGLLKLRLEELPEMEVVAACRIRHAATRICRASLGLRPRPHSPQGDARDGEVGVTTTTTSATTTTTTTTSASASASSAPRRSPLGPQAQPYSATPLPSDSKLICFSSSGFVCAVHLPAAAPLVRLQAAVQELGPVDASLLTAVCSSSYCHSVSWPLVLPRETAVGAGLAGTGSSIAAGGGGGGGAPPGGAGLGAGPRGGEGFDPEVDLEEEAQQLAEGCVDGGVLRAVLRATEAQLGAGEGEGGGAWTEVKGGAGGGGVVGETEGRAATLLQRLATEAVGSGGVAALAGLLQRMLSVTT